MTDHLTREQLLRFLDGELSRSSTARVADHLQSCWACRSSLDQLEGDIANILKAQIQVFAPSIPDPPNPWPRLEPRLAAAQSRPPYWKRAASSMRFVLRPSFAFATTALVAILIFSLVVLPVQPVSAKEVLRHVEVAEAQRSIVTPQQVIRQRVQIRKLLKHSSVELSANVDSWKSGHITYWDSGKDSVGAELQHLYKSFGISSSLPLSNSVLQSWIHLAGSEPKAYRERDGAIDVQVNSDPQGSVPGLQRVTFHVQPSNWHVDSMNLSFADADFEISELDFSVVNKREVPPAVLAILEPPAHPVEPRLAALVPSAPPVNASIYRPVLPNLDDVEVGVRYDLHRIGADLGESIEVSQHTPDAVIVNAWGISSERKAQLASLLDGKPDVRLEFQPPDINSSVAAQPARSVVIPQPPLPQQQPDRRLEQYFGSRDTEENYTRAVLDTSTTLLSHLYALRALAQRWPSNNDPRLSDSSRAELAAMVQDHAREVASQVDELKAELVPLMSGFGYQLKSDAPSGAFASWQDVGVASLGAGKQIDFTLRSLLTTSTSPTSVDAAMPRLQQQLTELDILAKKLLRASAQK